MNIPVYDNITFYKSQRIENEYRALSNDQLVVSHKSITNKLGYQKCAIRYLLNKDC